MKAESESTSITPNDLQRRASNPNKSVYVSASAGTGKTKVLTDRFIRLMLSGYPAKNILCLTFTNSATVEMKQRISSRLLSWNRLSDNELSEQITDLIGEKPSPQILISAKNLYNDFLQSESELNISTVHGFCQKILAKTELSKYDKDIVSSHQRNQIIKSVITNVIESNLESLSEPLQYLYQNFEQGYLEDIFSSILNEKIKFHQFYNTFENKESLKRYWFNAHNADIKLDIDAVKNIEAQNFKNSTLKLLIKLSELKSKSAIKMLLSFDDFSFDKIQKTLFTSQDVVKKLFTNKECETFTAAIEEFEKAVIKFINIIEAIKRYNAAKLNSSISVIAEKILNDYKHFLAEKQLMEFSDIIEFTREHLFESDNADTTLYKLDYTIDHILVDEAQDLSSIQWDLIKKISEEFFTGTSSRLLKRTIFIVGDYKQSICGFQGASPEIFLDIYDHYNEKLKSIGDEFVLINMQTSFRSTTPVIKAVNTFFNKHQISANFIDHISYKGGDGAVTCLDLIPKAEYEKIEGWKTPKQYSKVSDERNMCARNIALTIKSWLDSKRKIVGSSKIVEPQDIMIVLKKREPMMQYLTFHLKENGIPVANPDKALFANSLIINDLVCLARFVNYPYDDIALATLLKSPIFGITEEKLYEICSHEKNKALYSRINDEYILKRLELIQSCNRYDITYFYRTLESALNINNKYLSKYGEKYLIEFSSFMGIVKNVANDNPGISISEFIKISQDPNLMIENNNSSSSGEVKIMTTHASKGLQAAIVILADSTNSISRMDHFLWNKEIPFFNISKKKADTLSNSIKELQQNLDSKEDLRLLYVAMTRAENELHFAGTEVKGYKNSWYMKFKNINFTADIKLEKGDTIKKNTNKNICYIGDIKTKDIFKNTMYSASSKFKSFGAGAKFGNHFHHHVELLSKFPEYICLDFKDGIDKNAYEKAIAVKSNFAWMFGDNCTSEMLLVGNDNGTQYKYKIDKVIFQNDKIVIVDFKTDTATPSSASEIKPEYKKQLQRYARKLKIKFPKHKIEAGTLWINEMEYMQLFDL